MLPVLDDFWKNKRLPADQQLAPYLKEGETLVWAGQQRKMAHQRTTPLVGLAIAAVLALLLGWIAYAVPSFHRVGIGIFATIIIGIAIQAGLQLYSYQHLDRSMVYGLSQNHLWVLLPWKPELQRIPLRQLPKLSLVPTSKGTFSIFYLQDGTLPHTSMLQEGQLVYLLKDAEGDKDTIALFKQTIAKLKSRS